MSHFHPYSHWYHPYNDSHFYCRKRFLKSFLKFSLRGKFSSNFYPTQEKRIWDLGWEQLTLGLGSAKTTNKVNYNSATCKKTQNLQVTEEAWVNDFSFVVQYVMKENYIRNGTTCIRHQCRKTAVTSCHRCLINSGVEKMNNI